MTSSQLNVAVNGSGGPFRCRNNMIYAESVKLSRNPIDEASRVSVADRSVGQWPQWSQ